MRLSSGYYVLIIGLRCLLAIDLMDTLTVVKYPDIFKYCCFGFFTGFKMLFIKPFLFQLALEAFHWCVVPAVSSTAHAYAKSGFFCPFAVII